LPSPASANIGNPPPPVVHPFLEAMLWSLRQPNLLGVNQVFWACDDVASSVIHLPGGVALEVFSPAKMFETNAGDQPTSLPAVVCLLVRWVFAPGTTVSSSGSLLMVSVIHACLSPPPFGLLPANGVGWWLVETGCSEGAIVSYKGDRRCPTRRGWRTCPTLSPHPVGRPFRPPRIPSPCWKVEGDNRAAQLRGAGVQCDDPCGGGKHVARW